MITTAAFWRAAGERATKTFAQTLAASFALGVPVFDLDWVQGLGIAGTAAVLSVLTSVGSDATGAGPSLTNSEVIPADTPGKHAAE